MILACLRTQERVTAPRTKGAIASRCGLTAIVRSVHRRRNANGDAPAVSYSGEVQLMRAPTCAMTLACPACAGAWRLCDVESTVDFTRLRLDHLRLASALLRQGYGHNNNISCRAIVGRRITSLLGIRAPGRLKGRAFFLHLARSPCDTPTSGLQGPRHQGASATGGGRSISDSQSFRESPP